MNAFNEHGTFIDADGIEHTIMGYCNHGTRRNFMITVNKEKTEDEYEDALLFPQIWVSNHTDDETPVWAMRPENTNFTVGDILFHTMTGHVAGLSDYNFFNGEFK